VKYLKINPVTMLLLIIFAYPIVMGFLYTFSSRSLKSDIEEAGSNIAFITALFVGVYLSKKIFLEHDRGIYKDLYNTIPPEFVYYIENNNLIFYAVVIPIMIFIFYKLTGLLIELLNKVTLYPIIDLLESFIKDKSTFTKRVSGALFELPKAFAYVIFAAFVLSVLSMLNLLGKSSAYLESSRTYNLLCKQVVIPVTNSTLAKQLPNILNNSFKVVVKEADGKENGILDIATNRRVVVYYNGVTLEEGIKSNSKIDSFAKELTSKAVNSKDKAKVIYNWVGSNIEYDYDKANRVLSNDFQIQSGAIPTFQTREGICFDYACLYVAMARANNLKVRIMTGEGFNGVSWVSHAWNEVYIPEEDKWIKIDPTFYKGGNYFNSRRFDLDHRNEKVAGEW
jgi:hypothetical protein